MKKIIFAIVMVFCATKMSAQYFYPGPSLDIIGDIQRNNVLMQMQAQTNMLQMNYMNMLQQNAAAATWHMQNMPFVPMSGVVTREGDFISNDEIQNYERRNVDCDDCGGTGKKYENRVSYSTKTVRKVEVNCSTCHGRGTISRLVRK